MEENKRTISLIGEEAFSRLAGSHVAVFGLGGVGSYAVEALARAGVGELTLVDGDRVCESNINRQLIALHSTLGMFKADVFRTRIEDISPSTVLHTFNVMFSQETASLFDFASFDYVVDCVDDVTAKLLLAHYAQDADKPFISCMGAGNHLDGSKFVVSDIYHTKICPLAKRVRKLAKEQELKPFKAVYSEEEPLEFKEEISSISFVPSAAGLLIAGEVIKDLAGLNK